MYDSLWKSAVSVRHKHTSQRPLTLSPQEEGGDQAWTCLITVSFLSVMTIKVWQIRELDDMRGIVVLVGHTGWRGILKPNRGRHCAFQTFMRQGRSWWTKAWHPYKSKESAVTDEEWDVLIYFLISKHFDDVFTFLKKNRAKHIGSIILKSHLW